MADISAQQTLNTIERGLEEGQNWEDIENSLTSEYDNVRLSHQGLVRIIEVQDNGINQFLETDFGLFPGLPGSSAGITERISRENLVDLQNSEVTEPQTDPTLQEDAVGTSDTEQEGGSIPPDDLAAPEVETTELDPDDAARLEETVDPISPEESQDPDDGIDPAVVAADEPLTVVNSTSAVRDHTQDPPIFTRDNVLKSYSSVTYNVTISLMSPEQLNQIYTEGSLAAGYTRRPNSVIIASGGINQRTRNSHFDIDYGFDDLTIESVIGINGSTRNTNNVMIGFSLVEPYGITLIPRLVRASLDFGGGDYIAQPYMMEIEFKGYDEEGNPINLPEISKKIPFKIVNIAIETGVDGTRYNVEAIPYTYETYKIQNITLPFNIELTANKLIDIFNADLVTSIERQANPTDATAQPGDTIIAREQTRGLADALNRYQDQLVDREIAQYPDKFIFDFEGTLADATFTAETVLGTSPNSIPMEDRFQEAIRQSLSDNFSYDRDRKLFRVNQGTSLIELINLLIKGSSYMRDQVILFGNSVDDTILTAQQDNSSIGWWHIVTSLELGPYDERRRRYQHIHKIHIKSLRMRGQRFHGFGQERIQETQKKYNYLFTGDNTDVIDMNFELNYAYFQARSILGVPIPRLPQSSGQVFPETTEGVGQTGTTQGSGSSDTQDHAVSDLMQQLLSNAPNLALLTIRIWGDPDWIPQDDVYPDRPLSTLNLDVFTRSGSINSLGNEVYVDFKSRTPVDYNDETGLMDFESARFTEEDLVISGKYNVTRVKSMMRDGEFTQEVEMVRRPDPDIDRVTSIPVLQIDNDVAITEPVSDGITDEDIQ